MKSRILLLVLAGFSLMVGLPAVSAAGVGEAKARMRERVSSIDQLKLAEAVGENNRGYLEVRKAGGDAAAVVAAENRDREDVFKETAARAGSSAEAVGRAFARQIAAASKSGVWLQKDDGSWYKK